MPPIPLSPIALPLAVLFAGAVIAAGCGGSSGTGADAAAPRQAASEGGMCRPIGSLAGAEYQNKYRCEKNSTRAKWVLIEHASPTPKRPGLLPDGVWQCVGSGDNPTRVNMTVRGDVYTVRVGPTRYPHQRYREGSAPTPRGGLSIRTGSLGSLAGNVGEYVPAGSPNAVGGKDTLWLGREQSWPSGGWTCTK